MDDLFPWAYPANGLILENFLFQKRNSNKLLDLAMPLLVNTENLHGVKEICNGITTKYQESRYPGSTLQLNSVMGWANSSDAIKNDVRTILNIRFPDTLRDDVLELPATRKPNAADMLYKILSENGRPTGDDSPDGVIMDACRRLFPGTNVLRHDNISPTARNNPDLFYVGAKGASIFGLKEWIGRNNYEFSGGYNNLINQAFPINGNEVVHYTALQARARRAGRFGAPGPYLADVAEGMGFHRANGWISRNVLDPNVWAPVDKHQTQVHMRELAYEINIHALIGEQFFDVGLQMNLGGDDLDFFESALWQRLNEANYRLDGWGVIQAPNEGAAEQPVVQDDVAEAPPAEGNEVVNAAAPPAEPEVELDVFNGDANARQQVEQAAMQACTEYYSAQEETIEVLDVAARRCGWDIEVKRQDESTLYVEVKGRSGDGQQLIFTANEILQSNIHHESYEVFLVRLENGEVTRSHRQGPICAVLPHAPVIAVILDIEGMGGWVELR